jgi:hypothetical protein
LNSSVFAVDALSICENFVAGSDNISCTARRLTVNPGTRPGISNWNAFSVHDWSPPL